MMEEIERANAALLHIDSGCSREEWIKVGIAAKAAGLGFDEFHTWSASAANYAGEADCRAVWKSIREGGAVTVSTLFALAFAQGWQDPAKRQQAANGSRAGLAYCGTKKSVCNAD